GPAGLAANEAEALPIARVVELQDDTIDVVVEAFALLAPPGNALVDVVDVGVEARFGVDVEPHSPEPLERLVVAGGTGAFAPAELVDEHRERAAGGDRGVLLADGARGGVAGIRVEGERLTAFLLALEVLFADGLVHALEAALAHVDLAANFEAFGEIALQCAWDGGDGAEVLGDVLAVEAIAAG